MIMDAAEIHLDGVGGDAEACAVTHGVGMGRSSGECPGRNGTGVKRLSAQLALVDDHYGQPERAARLGDRKASRSGADDAEVRCERIGQDCLVKPQSPR